MIKYEDFAKLDLRIVKIIEATSVEKSEKLVKLTVDDGEGERTIVAGIGTSYDNESLVGKNIVIIANLEPRELFGIESQGMLLAADNDGKPVLLQPESEVVVGAVVK